MLRNWLLFDVLDKHPPGKCKFGPFSGHNHHKYSLGFSDELPVSIYLIGLDAFQRLPVDFYVVDLSFSVEFERDGSDGPIVRGGESRIDCGMADGFLPGQGMGRHGMSVETQ